MSDNKFYEIEGPVYKKNGLLERINMNLPEYTEYNDLQDALLSLFSKGCWYRNEEFDTVLYDEFYREIPKTIIENNLIEIKKTYLEKFRNNRFIPSHIRKKLIDVNDIQRTKEIEGTGKRNFRSRRRKVKIMNEFRSEITKVEKKIKNEHGFAMKRRKRHTFRDLWERGERSFYDVKNWKNYRKTQYKPVDMSEDYC